MAAAAQPVTWLQRQRHLLERWRDRILSDRRFIDAARRCPLTRPIARRRARALFDLCAGFVYSQVTYACVQLNLFRILAEGPQTIERLAHTLGLEPERLETLARAAAALELIEFRGHAVGLGPLGAALVANPGIEAMIAHHALLYADLLDPIALLKDPAHPTRLSVYWGYSRQDKPLEMEGHAAAAYSALMSASLPLVATEVLDVYPFHDHRRILDVGGGEGGFLCTIAATVPHVQGVVFDLPAVIPRTRERIARDGLAHRIKTVAGDFLSDPLPRECDLACLTRVLHDHDDETVMQILRAVHAALETGASVLIAEPLSKTRGARPVGDAYFGFYLLAMGRGRPRSAQELGRMLEAAGFVHVRRVPTLLPLQTGLLHAVRP